jgi:hypothetical protein
MERGRMEGSLPDTYDRAWRELERLRRFVFITSLIVVLLLLPPLVLVLPRLAYEWVMAGAASIWFVVSVKTITFRCPRCNRCFDVLGCLVGFSKCVHCGLKRTIRPVRGEAEPLSK